MPGSDTSQPRHPEVDPGRREPRNAFDAADGYSGQEFDRDRERAEGQRMPSGYALGAAAEAAGTSAADAAGRDIPPDNGRRASFDPRTGEVRGSGSGAGGGNGGEDFDEGTPGGGDEAPRAGAAPDR